MHVDWQTHSHLRALWSFQLTYNLHVFGLWEETGATEWIHERQAESTLCGEYPEILLNLTSNRKAGNARKKNELAWHFSRRLLVGKHHQTKGIQEALCHSKQGSSKALGDISSGLWIKGLHESSSSEKWERTAETVKKRKWWGRAGEQRQYITGSQRDRG